jgi:Xaa-Pro aminopeptidase
MQGGVRIEDDVVVTADGLRSLTNFPHESQVIEV